MCKNECDHFRLGVVRIPSIFDSVRRCSGSSRALAQVWHIQLLKLSFYGALRRSCARRSLGLCLACIDDQRNDGLFRIIVIASFLSYR